MMASGARAPSTPGAQAVASDAPTGAWTHPRMPEIQRRLNAATFGDRQIRSIASNLVLIAATIAFQVLLSWRWTSSIRNIIDSADSLVQYLVHACRLFAIVNIALALSPLFRKPDDLSDIPLTPTQRALLGLKPASKSATPGSQYVTPPRYSRTLTPGSRSHSRSGSPYSDSPLAGPAPSTNPYSPSASPLFQKAVGRDAGRRISQGSPSGLGFGRGAEQLGGSIFSKSPSPIHGKNAGVPFSNKWLYEKAKSSNLSFRNSVS